MTTPVSASLALQAAMVAALKPALAPVPVLDDVPQGQAFPYVQVGSTEAGEGPFVDADSEDLAATVHVWSRYAGQREAKELLAAVRAALHDRALDLGAGLEPSGHCRAVFETVFTEPDGRTRHGVIRFRAVIRRA